MSLNITNSTLLPVVAEESQSTQKAFLVKTYSNLILAVFVFAGTIFFSATNPIIRNAIFNLYRLPFATLIVMAIMIGVGVGASWIANNSRNISLHYIALFGYAIIEGFFFVPLIIGFLGRGASGITALTNGSILTVGVFSVLTLIVFITKPNLGFLGKFLAFGGLSALFMIVLSAIFGFNLGIWFTYTMIVLACGYILYETSEMLRLYDRKQSVACALSLFASITNLFFYILRLFGDR
jgi:FtsH-binding integral membrane protein